MLEKTIKRKVRSKFMIHTSDVLCAGVSLIIGGVVSPVGYVFALVYVTYSYLRNVREMFVAIFFILTCCLAKGIVETYFYALGFAIYFMLLYMLKYRHKNLYTWLPYMGFLVVGAFAYQAYGMQVETLLLPILWFVMVQQLFVDYVWTQKEFMLSNTMQGIIVYAIALCVAQVAPLYQEIIYFVALCNIIYIADTKSALLLLCTTYVIGDPEYAFLLLPLALLCVFKEQKKEAFLISIGSLCILPVQFDTYLYMCIAIVGLLLYPQKVKEVIHRSDCTFHSDHLIKRQMSNYATIFQLLADYYAQTSSVQSHLLANMANALQYNADMIRKLEGKEKDSEYIMRTLEGYQYDVKSLSFEEINQQDTQLQMEISNIKRGEIRTTLLPLLEGLLHRKLVVTQLHTHRFLNTTHSITIHDCIPFTIDAYADSVKNSYTSSGDTFSIFRFRQSIVCMISDGMGNGENAMKSSRLITNIFQRMMICGLTQDNAIRCINKLVQSDTFATLDVLCFNKAQGLAYISKSAACPTFLLRNKELYEISGNALPVGIVAQIQPDCFQIECKEDDEYLMVSDGVGISEIQEWIRRRKGVDVKEDVELFTHILHATKRSDDSTIILAKVQTI